MERGTRKSQHLLESTTIAPKDSVGNKQHIDRGLTFTVSDEGMTKTTPRPEGSLGDKDSWGNKPRADMEPINPTVVDPSGTGAKGTGYSTSGPTSYICRCRAFLLIDDEACNDHHQSPLPQENKPQSSHAPSTEASDTDSSCDDILKKYDNTLPLTKRQLEKHEEATVNYANLKAYIDEYYDENIAHRDDKLVEASMSSLDKSSTTIRDLYKGLNVHTTSF
ncbi:hypothetical protein Tco_1419572 [Tanacetum coccineum]